MTSLVDHTGLDVEYAHTDPATALASLFRPVERGRRPGGLLLESEHGGLKLRFAIWQALDTRDQSILLAAVGMAGMFGKNLHAGIEGDRGRELWEALEPAERALHDTSVVITTTRYALLQAAGLDDKGRNYGLLEECLERLSMVGCRAQKDGHDWSMRLLSYSEAPDGTIHIALNSRFATALGAHYVHVSLSERRAIKGEAAQIAHAWLCAWLRPGRVQKIHLDALAAKVWGDKSKNQDVRDKRRQRIAKALSEIADLTGWHVEVVGKGQKAILHIKRPRLLGTGQTVRS